MKRLVNGKKRSKVSLLITLVLCVAFIFGPGGIPLTAFAETETETQASVEETPAPEENVSVAAEGESSGKSVSDALPEQNGTSVSVPEEETNTAKASETSENGKTASEETASEETASEDSTMPVTETEVVQEETKESPATDESGEKPDVSAKSFTVTFDIGADAAAAGIAVPEAISVKGNETVGKLPSPVWKDEEGKTVKVFGGWYMDEGFSQKFDADTSVTGNMTVYAKWDDSGLLSSGAGKDQNSASEEEKAKEADSCTISFRVGADALAAGVAAPEDIIVKTDKNAGSLPVPVWNDTDGTPIKAFGGWYLSEDFAEEFAWDTIAGTDITLYAKWNNLDEKALYYVSFCSQDGSVVCQTMSAEKGRTVNPPEAPVLENKVFLGWSAVMQGGLEEEASESMEAFDFTVPVSEAVTDGGNTLRLYAWYGISMELDGEEDILEQASHKVSFDIGTEAREAGVAVPDDVFVNEEGTVDSLPAPVWTGPDDKPVKAFGGWYMDEDFSKEFDTDTVIKEDTVVYAKWNGLDEDDLYYVNFYSQDGSVVCLTLAVAENKTVNPPASAPVVEKKIFRGWSDTIQGDSMVTELVKFDFTRPVSEVVAEGSNTLNLYAWYGDEVSVSFISNGGTAVPTVVIAAGETVEEPVTEREGYTFRGWSESNTEFKKFDFSMPVITSITLYAFWEPKLVPVTLVYMYENANDSDYTPAGAGQTVYAPAGSYLSIRKRNITNLYQTHDIIYTNETGGEAAGYASGNASGTGRATLPDIRDTYFQYASASNNRFVMPDGTTVMLIYYNRARVTLKFTYGLSSNASIDVKTHISAADQAKYDVKYDKEQNGHWSYSFTAKYGENIVPVWPQIGWVKNGSGIRGQFYGWKRPDNDTQVTNMYTLEKDLFSNLKISNGELVGMEELPAVANNVNVAWAIYARTTLPGENPDFVYNNVFYTIYMDACQKLYSDQALGYKQLEGCTPIEDEPKLEKQYSDLDAYSISYIYKRNKYEVKTTGTTMQQVFKNVFSGEVNQSDRCQILLYDRNKISLSLHVNDDTYGIEVQKEDYLYNDWIYNDKDDLLKIVEGKMKKENYVFAGWYTDSGFTDGTQYVPDINSRITGNMELYAKWEPNQFKARFYLYTDDESVPYREEGFAEGGRITDWTVPPAVQDIFLGWYWYQNGTLQPFDFTSTVGQNHVDKDGILRLYARWDGTECRVSYLPGEGGDNSTQEVIDKLEYEINAASVMLPSPGNVWKDGTVPNDKGMTFVGWKAPNGAIYQPGRYVPVTRIFMQFEAQWSRDAVKLIYKANGGSGNDVSETWNRGSVVTVWDNMDASVPHFTREGYELAGWDKNKDAVEPAYKLGEESIILSEDETILYAIWKPSTVDVTIRKLVAGSMGDITKAFGFTVSCDQAMTAGKGYTLSEDGREARFALKHNETITLKGVRKGSTLTIQEENAEGYEITFAAGGDKEEFVEGVYTVPLNASEPVNITVTNSKEGDIPDTGVLLDSVPYILILAIVAISAFLFLRKRKNRDID